MNYTNQSGASDRQNTAARQARIVRTRLSDRPTSRWASGPSRGHSRPAFSSDRSESHRRKKMDGGTSLGGGNDGRRYRKTEAQTGAEGLPAAETGVDERTARKKKIRIAVADDLAELPKMPGEEKETGKTEKKKWRYGRWTDFLRRGGLGTLKMMSFCRIRAMGWSWVFSEHHNLGATLGELKKTHPVRRFGEFIKNDAGRWVRYRLRGLQGRQSWCQCPPGMPCHGDHLRKAYL